MKKTLQIAAVLIGFLLALAAIASAQTVDGYRLNIYNAGAAPGATPMQTFDFLSTAITCNLPPSTVTGVPVNPTIVLWDDPTNAGRECQWTDNATGPLFSVPVGAAYEAALQGFNAAGRGPESNRTPFSRLAPPTTAPTRVRLKRPAS